MIKTLRFFTIYPGAVEGYLNFGIMHQSQKKGLVHCDVLDLRLWGHDDHGSVDDRPYGGGEGMVLRADVLANAVKEHPDDICIMTSPSGEYFQQQHAVELLHLLNHGRNLSFVCGRFSGVDERFVQRYADHVYSMGDFVCSGGELPCLMIAESVVRLVPGVLSNPQSVTSDSFGENAPHTLHPPVYTRPECFEGCRVPAVLLSGDHQAITAWREKAALRRLARAALRPDRRMVSDVEFTERSSHTDATD